VRTRTAIQDTIIRNQLACDAEAPVVGQSIHLTFSKSVMYIVSAFWAVKREEYVTVLQQDEILGETVS